MQHISLTIRKMKLLALLLTMVVMPNMGFCQNTPQKSIKVDSMKQATTSQKSFETDDVKTIIPVEVTSNLPSLTTNGTILSAIQDTLNQIAGNTAPKFFLGDNTSILSSKTGFWALIVSVIAAIVAFFSFWYQMKSAKSLKTMEKRRLPYNVFANKLYDTTMVLDILIEIEDADCTDKIRKKRREGYGVEKLIDEMRLPDDLVDLTCYKVQFQYEKAYEIVLGWRSFNYLVDNAKMLYCNNEFESLRKMYDELKVEVRCLFRQLSEFEDIIKENISNETTKIRSDFSSSLDFSIKKLSNFSFFDNYFIMNIDVFVYPHFYTKNKFEKNKLPIQDEFNKQANCIDLPNVRELNVRNMKRKTRFEKEISNLVRKLSKTYQEMSQWMGGGTWIEKYCNAPMGAMFYFALKNYLEGKSNKQDKVDVTFQFLNKIMYEYRVAKKRFLIINNKEDFYRFERNYFDEMRREYVKFEPLLVNKNAEPRAKITLYDLMCAIVCEQNVMVSVHSMLFFDRNIGVNTYFYNGSYLYPLFEHLGISGEKEVYVKTKEELDEKVKDVPACILGYELFPSSNTGNFEKCVVDNLKIQPFASVK